MRRQAKRAATPHRGGVQNTAPDGPANPGHCPSFFCPRNLIISFAGQCPGDVPLFLVPSKQTYPVTNVRSRSTTVLYSNHRLCSRCEGMYPQEEASVGSTHQQPVVVDLASGPRDEHDASDVAADPPQAGLSKRTRTNSEWLQGRARTAQEPLRVNEMSVLFVCIACRACFKGACPSLQRSLLQCWTDPGSDQGPDEVGWKILDRSQGPSAI